MLVRNDSFFVQFTLNEKTPSCLLFMWVWSLLVGQSKKIIHTDMIEPGREIYPLQIYTQKDKFCYFGFLQFLSS